jgi:hypothetical protein
LANPARSLTSSDFMTGVKGRFTAENLKLLFDLLPLYAKKSAVLEFLRVCESFGSSWLFVEQRHVELFQAFGWIYNDGTLSFKDPGGNTESVSVMQYKKICEVLLLFV